MTQNLKIEVLTGDISIDGKVVTNLVTKEELSQVATKKADLGADGKIPTNQLPDNILNTTTIVDQVKTQLETSIKDAVDESNAYAESYTDNALSSKADLASGKVPLEQLPAIDQYPQFGTALSNLSTSILTAMKQRTDELEKTKASLGEDGKVLREQIPSYEKISGLPEQLEVMSTQTAAVSGELDEHKLQTADQIDILKENIEANVQQLTDRQSHLMRTYATKELGVDAKVGVKPGEYFYVRSENEEEMLVEYQNVGGVATPSGKSYPSGAVVAAVRESIIDPATNTATTRKVFDSSGASQEEINRYVVFLELFGASGNDEARDTAAFIEAVNSGATIRLQSGKNYILKTNRQVLGAGKSVRVIAEKDATITLRRGTHDEVFDATDADKIEFDGVNFLVDTGGSTALILRLCYYGAESYVNKVSITNCSSKGNFSINRVSGSQTRNPYINPFGFKEVYVNNNNFQNTRGFVFSVMDFPVYYSEFRNNTVRNFSNIAFNISNTNSTINDWKIGRISTTFVHDNIAKNDDDYWNEDSSGNYHCFLLFEGMNCSYQRNHVEGLKSKKSGIELYDAYMNTRHLVHCGNTYKNNGIFTTGDTTFNQLIKSKTDSFNDPDDPFATVTTKVVTGNTYTIESDWLKRIGYSSVAHKIMDLGQTNGGYAVVKDNTFSLDVLDGSRAIFENLTLAGNTIVCRDTLTSYVLAYTAVNSNSHLAMRDNHATILNPTKSVSFLNGDKSTSYSGIIPWKTLNMQNNSLTLVNTANQPTGNFMLRLVNAIEANISNMVVNADVRTDYSTCSFKRLNASNVSLVGKSMTSSLSLAYAYTMFGESCSETDYKGLLASDSAFKIHFDKLNPPSTPELFYNISLKLTTRDGVKQLDFSYKLIWDGINYSVVFKDSSDVEQTFVLGSTIGKNTILKSELTGGSATALSVRFINDATTPNFRLYGIPTTPCKYKIIVNVSE